MLLESPPRYAARFSVCSLTVDEDIEAVEKAAQNIRIPFNRHEVFNRLSRLPHPKAKMRRALKERIRHLAAIYISLATFIDDQEVEFVFNNPKSKRSREIALRVIADTDRATREMGRFRLIEKIKKSSRKDKEKLKKK